MLSELFWRCLGDLFDIPIPDNISATCSVVDHFLEEILLKILNGQNVLCDFYPVPLICGAQRFYRSSFEHVTSVVWLFCPRPVLDEAPYVFVEFSITVLLIFPVSGDVVHYPTRSLIDWVLQLFFGVCTPYEPAIGLMIDIVSNVCTSVSYHFELSIGGVAL